MVLITGCQLDIALTSEPKYQPTLFELCFTSMFLIDNNLLKFIINKMPNQPASTIE